VKRWSGRRITAATLEVLLAVGISTAAVAALNALAPATGLSVVYLLGVLVVAVRRGRAAALTTAVLGVLALNFFFIAPVHRLTIRDSGDVIALSVYLVVAVVVARLAADARATASEAEARAREAAARREESQVVAEIAALLLSGERVEGHLPEIGPRLARALGVESVVIELGSAPSPRLGSRVLALPLRHLRAWVQLPADAEVDRDDLDRVLSSVGALVDVAGERERLAQQAADAETTRRADAVKTAVLHSISHDLRSPLTAITTAGQALSGPALSVEDRNELLDVIREESQRLAHLVDGVLDLSRIQAQAIDPQFDWCDLRDVVASAARQARETTIAIELPTSLPLVRADPAQIERVLVNLLDNAARVSPPERAVRVTGGVGGGMVTVRVIDEGPGIPATQRASVFEPFRRLGRSGDGHGAGLGLAICKGFIEANGGRILLQPNPVGVGTAFAISLPLAPQPVESRGR